MTSSHVVTMTLLSALVLARAAAAQDAGDGFLYGQPTGSFTIRGGYSHANAGSDLFSFTTQQLTLSRKSFDAFDIAADLALRVTPRMDMVLSAGSASSSTPSEFRNWQDQDSLPIQQTTRFTRVPLTIGAKFYLLPRGQMIGHYAWIPADFAPYVGAGGGAMWYRFEQNGDFVDFNTLDIFPDEFTSTGWAPTGHVFAGFDYSLTAHFALTTEARYTWANAPLSDSFSGFHRIDLSGYTADVGVTVRF